MIFHSAESSAFKFNYICRYFLRDNGSIVFLHRAASVPGQSCSCSKRTILNYYQAFL